MLLTTVETRSQDRSQESVSERRSLGVSEFRFVEAAGQPPRITGYAARFNTPSHPIAVRGKKFIESIAPGAFSQALGNGGNTVLRVEHRDLPLADTATGTLKLVQDSVGLRFEAELDPSDPDVQRIMPKLRRGTMKDMSFAFRAAAGGDRWEMRDGVPHRTLADIAELEDVAVVAKPAYPETSIALRSLDSWTQSAEGRAAGATSDDNDGDELADCAQPKFAEGTLVEVTAKRYNARTGAIGKIAEAHAGALPYYSIQFGEDDGYGALPEKWYTEDEIVPAPKGMKIGDRVSRRSKESNGTLRKKLELAETR